MMRHLQFRMDRMRQAIIARTLTALARIRSNSTNVFYTNMASNLAEKNLEQVTLKFVAGKATLTEMIDAQHSAFIERQRNALAEYTWMQSVIDLQRSFTWFPWGKSPDAQKKWEREWAEQFDATEKNSATQFQPVATQKL